MGKTDVYKLGYLEPNQSTDTIELDMDERRFHTIENQTLNLYKIFGNGVIDSSASASWLIQNKTGDTTGTIVQISPGKGHISFMSAYTLQSTDLSLILPPGADYPIKFYIYATSTDTTPDQGTVNFIASITTINDPDNYIGLGAVEATIPNGSVVLTPLNDSVNGRVNISLFSALTSVVNNHKHIGGVNNPSPINLQTQVQGKLSGDNIENLDLSAVTKGTLAAERLPLINHEQLDRIGILTHPQIDTLLTDLYKQSDNRLSDLQLTNTLKLALALYRQDGMPEIINKYLVSGILFVPGINNDRDFAYYAPNDIAHINGYTTKAPYIPTNINLADIDKQNNLIVGKTAAAIEGADQIFWTDNYDFQLVKSQPENVNSDVLIVPEETGAKIEVLVNTIEYKFTTANGLSHGLAHNDMVKFTSSTIPTGTEVDKTYYAILLPSTSEFRIASSPDGAALNVANILGATFEFQKLTNAHIILPKPVLYQGLAFSDLSNWKQGYKFIDNSEIVDSTTDQFVDTFDISRYLYYEFSTLKNISNINKLGIGYGLNKSDSRPGNISLFFILSEGESQTITSPDGSDLALILSSKITFHLENDIISNSTYKVLNINEFGLSEDQKLRIKGVGICYDTTSAWDKNEIIFQLVSPTIQQINDPRVSNPVSGRNDESAIFIWNDASYSPEETIIFRVDSGYSDTDYNLIKHSSDIPAGTQIKVTSRVADTSADLDTALVTNLGTNGEVNNGTGSRKFIDIIVKLTADSTLLKTPVLNDILLSFTGPGASQSPKIWSIAKQWNEGDLTNTAVLGDVYNEEWMPVVVATSSAVSPVVNGNEISVAGVIDGVTLAANDRILLKNSNNTSLNGIYTATVITTVWRRVDDAMFPSQFPEGKFVQVLNGTVNKNKVFKLSEPISTINIDPVVFEEYNNSLVISNTGNVGRYIYLRNNQLYYSFETSATEYEENIYESGSNLYLSPWQIFSKILSKGFVNPKDIQLLPSGNLVFIDSDNDRIVELDTEGQLIKGIQGNIRLNRKDRDFVITNAFYNNTLTKMWITFSQNVSVKDKTKMYLTNDRSTISFGATNPDVATDVINVVLYAPINNVSATLEVTFAKYFSDQINSWTNMKFIIDTGAVECKGSSAVASSTEETAIDTSTWEIPSYLIGPPNKYKMMTTSNSIKKMTNGLPELPSTTITDSGDFDGDGLIGNNESSTLYGNTVANVGHISIDVTVANIVMDNIYEPLSLQIVDDGWLVACVGTNSANFYGSDLVKKWYIPSTYAAMRENASGAAWKLASGYVVLSTPAPVDLTSGITTGEIVVVNKDVGTVTSPQYSIVSRITTSGDPVKTIPNSTETEFWVAINDRLGNGKNSRVIRVDYSGKIKWAWGNGIISAPTGLRILNNGDLLISE